MYWMAASITCGVRETCITRVVVNPFFWNALTHAAEAVPDANNHEVGNGPGTLLPQGSMLAPVEEPP